MPAPTEPPPAPAEQDKLTSKSKHIPWAELLRKTFGFEIVCSKCQLRLIALIKTEAVAKTNLKAMHVPTEIPELHPAHPRFLDRTASKCPVTKIGQLHPLILGRMNGVLNKTRRSPRKFFLLVYVLTVPFWVLNTRLRIQGLPDNLPVTDVGATFVPLAAALILVLREEGWDGVKRLLVSAIDHQRIKNKIWYIPIIRVSILGLLCVFLTHSKRSEVWGGLPPRTSGRP